MEYLLNYQINWIKDADTKASILLAVIGVLFTLFYKYLDPLNINCCHNTLVNILNIMGLTSLCLSELLFLVTIAPSLKIETGNHNSYIYFGNIVRTKNFKCKLGHKLECCFNPSRDLIDQVSINAYIAYKKMIELRIGICFTIIGFVLNIILMIFLDWVYL